MNPWLTKGILKIYKNQNKILQEVHGVKGYGTL